jgi:hypothetical protein
MAHSCPLGIFGGLQNFWVEACYGLILS